MFHSVSAVTILHNDPPGAGASALVLFDPPIFPTSGEPLDLDLLCRRFSALARRRRARFELRSQFAELLRRTPLFARMVPGARNSPRERPFARRPTGTASSSATRRSTRPR